MNQREYEQFRSEVSTASLITAQEIGGPNRTLAYGYTVDRDDWHAYLEDGELHVLVYDEPYVAAGSRPTTATRPTRRVAYYVGEALEADVLRPNKRVYPDTVDLRFARIMRDRGYDLPFLGNFNFDSPTALRRAVQSGLFVARTANQLSR